MRKLLKVKDLLKFDPEAEIVITLNHANGGSTMYNASNCRYITFNGTRQNDDKIEMIFTEQKNSTEPKRRAVGVPS